MLRLVNVARTRVVLVLPTTSSYCLRNHFSTDDKKDGGSSSSSSELVIPLQAANNATTWSPRQNDKVSAYSGPRFEQTDLAAQPNPPSAMELINQQPVKVVHSRVVSCDGGGGALGHPKVYINLDTLKPRACGYCGNKFQMETHHH